MFRKSKSVVGLDIGSSQVKAVELRGSGKSFRVSAFAAEAIPADSIVDGAIIDAAAVVGAIKRLFGKSKNFKSKMVCASLSGNTVIVKKITVPAASETELRDSIHWEAEQYIPFDIQDVNLDYQVLPSSGGGTGGTMDVLLVAAKKEKIGDYTNVITQAGRIPVVVDVDAFALQNAYEANYGLTAGQVVILLNAGASVVNINVMQGEQSIFTRDVSIGGNAYTEAVQKELGLPFEVAEELKKGVPVDGATVDDAQPVVRAVTENVLLEIQKTIDFFKATTSVTHIERVMLSGGLSYVDGFREALAARLGVPVEYFDPFKTISWDPKALGGVLAVDVAATAAVAVGLALRQAGDQ